VHKTHRYRIYPTKSQRIIPERNLELCSQVYNDTSALRKDAWEKEQRSISLYEINHIPASWKAERPELKEVCPQDPQNVQVRVDLALKAFFLKNQGRRETGLSQVQRKGPIR
jgi:putative transposase